MILAKVPDFASYRVRRPSMFFLPFHQSSYLTRKEYFELFSFGSISKQPKLDAAQHVLRASATPENIPTGLTVFTQLVQLRMKVSQVVIQLVNRDDQVSVLLALLHFAIFVKSLLTMLI